MDRIPQMGDSVLVHHRSGAGASEQVYPGTVTDVVPNDPTRVTVVAVGTNIAGHTQAYERIRFNSPTDMHWWEWLPGAVTEIDDVRPDDPGSDAS